MKVRRIDVQACADGWATGVCASPLSKLGELFGAKHGFCTLVSQVSLGHLWKPVSFHTN